MKDDEALDRRLATEAARGSDAAFESLVRRHQGFVRGFLRRLTQNPATADDLAQETFVKAWRGIAAWRGDAPFRTWIARVAYTAFLQATRGARRALARDTAWAAEAETLSDDAAGVDARLDMDRVMAVLTPEQRAVMALIYGEGLSQSEAADALGLPLGTVKSHVVRGRARALALFEEGDRS